MTINTFSYLGTRSSNAPTVASVSVQKKSKEDFFTRSLSHSYYVQLEVVDLPTESSNSFKITGLKHMPSGNFLTPNTIEIYNIFELSRTEESTTFFGEFDTNMPIDFEDEHEISQLIIDEIYLNNQVQINLQ